MSGDVFTVDHIHHIRYDLSDQYPKPRNLVYVLEIEQPQNAIIFCNTRDDTSLVTAVLNRNGFDAETLNGDLPQKERERVMAKVKRGELDFMVATDIAARGIDISGLGHVINYSLPEDPASYLHRVGRTCRIGNKGVAINLTSGKELMTLTTLEKRRAGIHFEAKLMPSPDEALRMWTDRHVREIRELEARRCTSLFLSFGRQIFDSARMPTISWRSCSSISSAITAWSWPRWRSWPSTRPKRRGRKSRSRRAAPAAVPPSGPAEPAAKPRRNELALSRAISAEGASPGQIRLWINSVGLETYPSP